MQPKNNQNQTVVPVENRKINLDIMKPNLKHQTILWDIASQNYIETSLQHCHEHLISSYQQDNIHTYIYIYTHISRILDFIEDQDKLSQCEHTFTTLYKYVHTVVNSLRIKIRTGKFFIYIHIHTRMRITASASV